jgi:DNA gyrase subunit A
VLPVRGFDKDKYVFMVASDGTVKKTALTDFSRPRTSGIIAIDLKPESYLVDVGLTDGRQHIFLFTDAGKAIRFAESDVRVMGRVARGVRGIALKAGQSVISLIIADSEDEARESILAATENGYGKRTGFADFSRQGRGGQGVIAIRVNQRNGLVVGAITVTDEDELMLITNGGTLVRTRALEVSVQGRNTQGVRLIGVQGDERLASIERVVESNDPTVEEAPDSDG